MIMSSVNADNITLSSSNSTQFLNIIESRSDGDIVTLNPDGVYSLDEDNVDIHINDYKNITIKSSNSSQNAIINCSNLGRAFYIESEAQLTLINITIINGPTFGQNGGAIYNYGTLTLTGCNFTNNEAGFGGAIFNCGTINLTDCTFTNNTADWGGAIYNGGGTINLTGCIFDYNYAHYRGGAIDNDAESGGLETTLTADDCIFTNNMAMAWGAAIGNYYGSLILTACNFTNNTCVDAGGAIYNPGTANLTGCTFTNNTCVYYGGAICNEGTLDLIGSTFTNNEADYGGAIYNCGFLTIYTCNFTSNKAIYGGVIYNANDLTADTCIFRANKVIGSDGPVVYNDVSGTVHLIKCAFTNDINSLGESLTYSIGDSIVFTNCTFYDNLVLEIENTLALGLNSSEYPSDSWVKFQTALNDAIVMNDAKSASSQAVIIQCINDLREAIGSLISVNYSSLEDAIHVASGFTAKGYTTESWNKFQSALASAVAMNNTRNIASQEEVNNIANALNVARVNLAPIDYTPVLDAIHVASLLDSSKYTPDSWAKYQDALNAVINMNNNRNSYTQDEINDLLTALDVAKGNLGSRGTQNTDDNVNTPKSDLTITKITKDKKKANVRYVFIKNIGKKASGKFVLGVYIGKKLIKKVNVNSIKAGKPLKVKIVIPKKYMTKKYKNMVKIFKLDIKNVVKESNEDNNSKKAK